MEVADALPDGCKLWLEWNEVCVEHGSEKLRRLIEQETKMLRVDDGRTFGFTRVVGRLPGAVRLAGSPAVGSRAWDTPAAGLSLADLCGRLGTTALIRRPTPLHISTISERAHLAGPPHSPSNALPR